MLFYHKIFAVTFDSEFATATGIRAGLYSLLLSLLTAVTIVVGMRLIGAILISGLVIFPPLSAMRISRSFKGVVILSAVISVCCFIPGLFIACAYSLQTGPAVILVNLAVYLILTAAAKVKKQ